MFSKNQIMNLLALFELSDNKDFKLEKLGPNRSFCKNDLIEAKVQIDRWGVVTTVWIFHSSKENMIRSLFPEEKLSLNQIKQSLDVIMKSCSDLQSSPKEKYNNLFKMTDQQLLDIAKSEKFSIWGADVYFTDNIDPHLAIGAALNKDLTLMPNDTNITNSIVVFNVE